MTTITSSQLTAILETNAKSIEIYLEVEQKYDALAVSIKDIKDQLEELADKSGNHTNHNEKYLEKMVDQVKIFEEKIKENRAIVDKNHKESIDSINKVDKTVSNQNKILLSGLGVVILAVIGKVLGLPIP